MAAEMGAHAPERDTATRAWVTATVAALLVAAVSAVLNPLMALPDEPAHTVHAVAVARGELVGDDAVRTDPETGWTRTETTVEVPDAYAELPSLPTCFAFRPSQPADCAPAVDGVEGGLTPAETTVGTYAPAWYAAVGWPSRVLSPPAALYTMRLVAAAIFAGLVGIAVAATWRVGARRWGLVGVALAVPPVAVHLAGGLNPSGTEIAAAVALWASSVELVRRPVSRAAVVRWAVAGAVVAVVRPLGPLVAAGIPVTVWLALSAPGDRRRLLRDRRARIGGSAVVAAVLAALAWNVGRGTWSAFSGFPEADATLGAVLRQSVALVPERLVEMVGVLGWADVALPQALVAAWLLGVGVLVVGALRRGDGRLRTVLVLLALGVLVLPVLADVRSAPSIGFVWQGRYTLPIAAGLPLLAGVVVDVRRGGEGGAGRGHLLALAAVAVGHLVALLAVARRFGAGADAGLVDGLTAATWTPPVPLAVLLPAAVVALGLPVVALAAHRTGSNGRTDDTG